MKKLAIATGIIVMLASSCQKEMKVNSAKESIETQAQPVCGMEQAMALIPPSMRNQLSKNAETNVLQAQELLIFLDFDGAVVHPGFGDPTGTSSPIVNGTRFCPPAPLNADQTAQVIALVEDDYSPFRVVFTTNQADFLNYPSAYKGLCIITTIPQVIGMPSNTGGVSPFVNLGTRLPFNPCFVFASLYANDIASLAFTMSHEIAHTLGLAHQSVYNEDCQFLTEYHPAFGTGPLSFSPIMGNGGSGITNWFSQPCPLPSFGTAQNDFALINTQVTVKNDDFPDDLSGALTISGPVNGILEKQGDVDYIKINFRNPGPVTVTSDNIDLKVSVYNAGGQLMGEYNDPVGTGVTIPSVNGNRFLKVEGASNANMSSLFMTGKYEIIF